MLRVEPKREELLINVTPMIDVMIFLIVFFLAATNFAEIERQQDIELPATRSTGPLSTTLDSTLIVNVKRDGQIYVAGQELSEKELEAVVRRRLEVFKSALRVEVRGDWRGSYGNVARVVAAIRKTGVSRAALNTKDSSTE